MLGQGSMDLCSRVTRPVQSGMVMVFALIILVLMSLGGLALMRSMDTSNLIAGNMAFQQAATHSADAGIETAIAWLETNKGALDANNSTVGYTANSSAANGMSVGEVFWTLMSPGGVCLLPLAGGVCAAAPGVADAAGNTIAFMIQRLCGSTGAATTPNICAIVPGNAASAATAQGNNEGATEDVISPIGNSTAVYYQITVRVGGPRNTVSFVQAVVSM